MCMLIIVLYRVNNYTVDLSEYMVITICVGQILLCKNLHFRVFLHDVKELRYCGHIFVLTMSV